MKIYLLRHATAADIAASDAERALTADGQQEARVTGRALAKLGVRPGLILHSPLRRAQQTAEMVGLELGFTPEIAPYEQLCNGQSTRDLLRGLKRFGQAREILLVGHMPSLADHLANLIGTENSGGLSFGRGTLACVELRRQMVEMSTNVVEISTMAGCGELRWFLEQLQQRAILL